MKAPTCAILLLASCVCLVQGGRISDFFGRVEDRMNGEIEKVIGQFRKSIGEMMSDMGDIRRQLSDVAHCFEAEFPTPDRRSLNIFDPSLNFTKVVAEYYESFNKTMNPEGVKNLASSVREMISHCLNSAGGDSSVKMGFTSLSDMSDDDLNEMFGATPGEENAPSERRRRSTARDSQCQVDSSSSLPSSFDWRDEDKVTSVKNQKRCGSCWSFASTGALESAHLIKNNQRASQQNYDLSEQQLVNCAKQAAGSRSGGCQGGTAEIAYSYIMNNGQTSESDERYRAREGTCHSHPAEQRITDYCVRSKYYYNRNSVPENLDDDTIMRALVQNGPLYFTINATPLQRNYRGGVVDEPNCSTRINHAVLLVGFDGSDNSYIIQNSWGPYWGNNGYFKVVRGKNMCGINTEIAWPIV